MELVHKAEKALEGIFKAVPPLPKDAKKGLASILPWVALIGGVLQLWGAWQLYRWADSWSKVADWANAWARSLGVDSGTSGVTFWVWISVAVAALTAVLLLAAFPKLQKNLKGGWDLMFLAGLVNLLYGISTLFIEHRGVGNLIGSLIGSAIGFYLLYQVREYFGGKVLTSTPAGGPSETKSDDAEKKSE